MTKYFVIFAIIFFGQFGQSFAATDDIEPDEDTYQTVDELLYREPDETPCATAAFANALAANINAVSEEDEEGVIQQWIHQTFAQADVLRNVLACPEFQNIADDDQIKLQPIKYTFPHGREIVINYETQPQILKQRLVIASKRNVDALNDPSPRIGALDDNSIWTNTDPAWYAILVTEHGALDKFVGPDKNNTISLQYIEDNIDSIYPQNSSCTDKTAWADSSKPIHKATKKTVGVDDDTNEYYVAGDASLHWVSYVEIGLDVVLTVVTFGAGQLVTGTAKSARILRTMNKLRDTMREVMHMPEVVKYIKLEQRVQKNAKEIARLKKLPKSAKNADRIKDLEKDTKNVTKAMRDAAKNDKNVKKYADASKSYSELSDLAHTYRNAVKVNKLRKNAKTGNVVTRLWKAYKANRNSTKVINKGARVARSSMKSGRVRDWLFHSTMKHAARLGRLESQVGVLYTAGKIALDMYDWTETSTGDYTNGVKFKPLGLLSADDLSGQENVVNYGMWLLWYGGSTLPEDDDAAYLQAMDFAEKFHDDLMETMDEQGKHPCNVDIYVVRPVLRNPDDNPEMYYLIMNDTPWTTVE